MMKLTLLLLSQLLSTSAFSAEKSKTAPANEQYASVSIAEDSTMAKLLTVPGVSQKYEECQKDLKTGLKLEDLPGCIWGKLSDDQKDKVKDLYAQEDAAKNKNSSDSSDAKDASIDVTAGKSALKTNLTDRKTNISNNYKSDPTVVALSAFFGQRLDEVLNGDPADNKAKKISTVDHTKFIELYTSELGKSIINAFTSYCMETKDDCRPPVSAASTTTKKKIDDIPTCLIPHSPSEREAAIQANINGLKTANFSKEEGAVWERCIFDVSKVCYDESKIVTSQPSEDKKYSKQKACLVMDFVKAARKGLIASNEQIKFYEGLGGGGAKGIASIATNMNVMDGDKKLSADQLTQINSSDISKDFKDVDGQSVKIAKAAEELKKEADDCIDDGKQIKDSEKCKKFLTTGTQKNTDALAEFGLKQIAQEKNLEKKLENDKNVADYLKEEGYSKQKIEDMLKGNIEDVKKQIGSRFAAEKDSIIKEMADRISKKTSTDEGKIAGTNDGNKIDKIRQELSSKNNELANLIHFNNIVASYLIIVNTQTKKETRNTASLYSEVNSYKGDKADLLKENLKKGKDIQQSDSSTVLEVENINQNFLKYDEKNPKAP